MHGWLPLCCGSSSSPSSLHFVRSATPFPWDVGLHARGGHPHICNILQQLAFIMERPVLETGIQQHSKNVRCAPLLLLRPIRAQLFLLSIGSIRPIQRLLFPTLGVIQRASSHHLSSWELVAPPVLITSLSEAAAEGCPAEYPVSQKKMRVTPMNVV